jgi:hypothetical protein
MWITNWFFPAPAAPVFSGTVAKIFNSSRNFLPQHGF